MRILLSTLVFCLITSCADAKSKEIIGKKVLLSNHRAGIIVGRSEGGYIILDGKTRMIEASEEMARSRLR